MRLEKEKNVVADQVYPIIVVHLARYLMDIDQPQTSGG